MSSSGTSLDNFRSEILLQVEKYGAAVSAQTAFVPGETPIPVAGRVWDADDMRTLVDSALDMWLTTGRFAAEFERSFARFMGARDAVLVNSGSSANLVAVSALTSPRLGDRRLKPGDEVITVAAGFPTTVNPIVQNGLVPVFVDVHIPTYNIDVSQLEQARSDRTRAIVIAHTLGNPFDLDSVTEFVRKHDLWLIEDCCDAVGAGYAGRKVGTFGDLATTSFYPAHHITMGEGGSVLTQKPLLTTIVESFRDWGRDCWCNPGKDNTCGKRFEWELGTLPCGYDHKYTYSHIGYNLKLTDMQAALGVSQLKKLPGFIERRRANFQALQDGLKSMSEWFILPEATPKSQPSWFGFPISVRETSPFRRDTVVKYLESKKIATRLLFGGNLTRQPAYSGVHFRVAAPLDRTDSIMNNTFWIGVYPGITRPMIDYILQIFAQMPRDLCSYAQCS
jgi:CDP-6-deoxy-D-xylo-4-hexulose-3-dehydrase